MDPLTLMAGVTAAYNGLKHAVSVGKEVEGVFNQLSKWADAAGQLQDFINKARDPNKQERIVTGKQIGRAHV